jgi:NTE family protein
MSTSLREVRLDAGEYLCRQGEPGDSLFLIDSGLIEVWLETSAGTRLVRRLRQGDIVGEMALLTGEPRSAHVIANVPSSVLELDAQTFASITARNPKVLHNVALALIEREHASAKVRLQSARGEAVALVIDDSHLSIASSVVAAFEHASKAAPIVADLGQCLETATGRHQADDLPGFLANLDHRLQQADRVLAVVPTSDPHLGGLLRHMDRAVLLTSRETAAKLMDERLSGLTPELFLVGEEASLQSPAGGRVVRTAKSPLSAIEIQWLGRHLSRTKLGLALGAGGAKGFAHVGAFKVLEDAGYVFDYVAGSSIGSILGSGVAMGMSGAELSETAHRLLSREVCGPYFRLTSGTPDEPGHQLFYQALSQLAAGRRFEDLPVPLGIMTADLNAKQAYLFRAGSLEDALHAALAIPGLAPPVEREAQRLVDGVTISPVPTAALKDMGADITVSVNLMAREELDRWPEDAPVPKVEKKRSKTLDPMIETLIMLQTDTSVRNAAEADVVISPKFAPSSWRDIHLADRFEAAGRRAASEQLTELHALASPQNVLTGA